MHQLRQEPIDCPEVYLEVDHREPHSKGGSDDDSNLQNLCRRCNRGKGNDEQLNKAIETDFLNRVHRINPEILLVMTDRSEAWVVANAEEFAELRRLNENFEGYSLEPSTNTIIGFAAGRSLGIYTLNDNGGAKTHFRIAPRD